MNRRLVGVPYRSTDCLSSIPESRDPGIGNANLRDDMRKYRFNIGARTTGVTGIHVVGNRDVLSRTVRIRYCPANCHRDTV